MVEDTADRARGEDMTTDVDKRVAQIEAQAMWLQSTHTHNIRPTHCDECSQRGPCESWVYADDMLWLAAQLRAAEEKI